MARTSIGLDIGSTSARAAEVALGSDPPAVVRAAQVPLPPGAVEGGEIMNPPEVGQALRELWGRGGFRGRRVTLGVGNQRVVVREVSVPSLPTSELRQSLPFQVQELIPIPVEQAVLDFDVLEEFEQEGRSMVRLLVVAAQRSMIDLYVQSVLGARLEPVGIDLVPFALVRSVGRYGGLGMEETDAGGEAIVDLGADITNLCVHERGVPRFVRIIPSGGRDVTASLAAALGVSEEQAEAMKRGLPTEAPVPPGFQERLKERMTTLADEIRSSLDFYRAQTPGAQVSGVLLTGGGSKTQGLEKLMSDRIGIPVERGDAFARVTVEVAMADDEREEAEPLLSVAIGLALPQEERA